MLDKYAVLLSRGSARLKGGSHGVGTKSVDKGTSVGQFHERGTVLPFAVSLEGGTQTFTVSKVAGCSSLLNFTDPAVRANWAPFCKDTLEKRTVDTISPAQLGALLPPDLPIRALKIDAQGLDLKLLKAMPEEIWSRTLSVQLEVRL